MINLLVDNLLIVLIYALLLESARDSGTDEWKKMSKKAR